MTELQLVLVRLFAVSLWLLRTRRVETVATWRWVRFLQHSDRPILALLVSRLEDIIFVSAIVVESGCLSVSLIMSSISLVVSSMCGAVSSRLKYPACSLLQTACCNLESRTMWRSL